MSSKSPGQKRRLMVVNILMLDDTEIPFQIEGKINGIELINLVYEYLKLVESDYFGLEYIDSKTGKKCWLDYDKPVIKQVQSNDKLIFGIKFYTPDPGQLEEEYTRYLYALQIKRDLYEGLLLCSDATACLLVSYILQAEIGDYLESFNENPNYFQNKRYFPHQNDEHVPKIIDYHKSHNGQTPADADLNLLDIARKVELYGVVMHPAKDHEGVQLNLAVANMGILVFQNFTKINTFSWAKIRKLSFRRKKFLVKLHSENYGFYKDTVEFYFDNRDDSKSFWKKCIEHHSFFRCISIMHMPRQKSKLFATRGSSFRYYGRTQKELIESARENFSKNRLFDRSYHSIRSIVTGSNATGQINGTQSLNRNLASRSAGALIIPSNVGCGSTTLSSNDSDQNYNMGMNQNTSSSAHHLSYNIPQNKSATLQDHADKSALSLRSLDEQKINEMSNLKILNSKNDINENCKIKNKHRILHDDTSTHGSRTIDSRYSHDKTLGLSDDDECENNGDYNEDQDDEDAVEEIEDNYREGHLQVEDNIDIKDKSNEDTNQQDICSCGHQHEEETSNKDGNQSIYKDMMPSYSEKIENSAENKNNRMPKEYKGSDQNSSTFKAESVNPLSGFQQTQNMNISNSNNSIKLPIQHQRPNKIKLEINNSAPTTDNESLVYNNNASLTNSNNPNKIYSRKEVITTSYKEEIKNTHLEEYHQTTTFYDSPNLSAVETSSSFNPSLLIAAHNHAGIHDSKSMESNSKKLSISQPKTSSLSSAEYNKDQKHLKQTSECMYDLPSLRYGDNAIQKQVDNNNHKKLTEDYDDEGKRLYNLDNKIKKDRGDLLGSCSGRNDNNNNNIEIGDIDDLKQIVDCNYDKKTRYFIDPNSDGRYMTSQSYLTSSANPNLNKKSKKDFGDKSINLSNMNNSETIKSSSKKLDKEKKESRKKSHKKPSHSEQIPSCEYTSIKLPKNHRHRHCHKRTQNSDELLIAKTSKTDQINSFAKLTKAPIFLTSNIEDGVCNKHKFHTKINESGLVLHTSDPKKMKNDTQIQTQRMKKKKSILTNDNFNFMSISDEFESDCDKNNYSSQKYALHETSQRKNEEFTFSISSSVSTSSLSCLKDFPLPYLSSTSSSSEFSFINKPIKSSSSSMNLSTKNSSTDSLRISMLELNKMSADLNKKLFRTFKNDPKYSKKKSEIPIQESDSLDQNETRLINKTKKMAETSELHSGEQNSRNNMYNMVGIVQFNELEEQKDCENVDLILTEQNQNESRKEESTKSKKNKAKCSKNSNSSKYRRKFKSLPREERKKKLDIRESDKQRDVRDWCMSQEVIGVKCIGHDFRKNVDKFDLYLTSSVSVNGSTPMNSTKVKKSKSRKRSEESKKSAIKNSNLVSQKTIEILDDKSENKESEDYKPENMEQEDDKTIRQILDKIVEAKLQKLPSPIQQEPKTTNENENILQNESPLIDNDIDYAQKIEKYTEKENSSKNIASGHMLLENIDEKDMDENITSTVENIQEIERGLLKNDHENEKKDVQTHDLRASPSKSFNELDFEDSLKNSFDENTSPIYSPSEEKSESINGQSNFLKNSPDKNISQIENLKNDTSELINELESASNSLVLQDCQSKDGTENLIFLKNDSEEEESYKENTKEPQSLEEEDDLSKKENASIEDEEKNNSQSSDINESEKKKEEINAQSCDKSVDEKVSTNIADCSINTNESQIIAKTVYKVLEKAKEIVEEEYKLNKLTKKD